MTLDDKLRICELAKKGRTLQSLANEFAIGKSTVHATACQAIETVLTYLEQQPFTPMTAVVTINGLLIETAKKE